MGGKRWDTSSLIASLNRYRDAAKRGERRHCIGHLEGRYARMTRLSPPPEYWLPWRVARSQRDRPGRIY